MKLSSKSVFSFLVMLEVTFSSGLFAVASSTAVLAKDGVEPLNETEGPAPSPDRDLLSTFAPTKVEGSLSGPAGKVTVILKHDKYPMETGWKLTKGSRTIGQQRANSVTTQNKRVKRSFNLGAGRYRFRISDTSRDGICCRWGRGYWEIYVDDSGTDTLLYASDGVFGSEDQIFFDLY
jgi:hypothetical protein